MNIDYNDWAKRIYAQNVKVGWWENPNRCIYQTLQLVSTEVSEATEGERKELMDDHIPEYKMGHVELADATIRMLDIGGRFDLDFGNESSPHRWARQNGITVGKQHLSINATIIAFANIYELMVEQHGSIDEITHPKSLALLNKAYNSVLSTIEYVAVKNGYDLLHALVAKNNYNATRAQNGGDHSREARAKIHGKKF